MPMADICYTSHDDNTGFTLDRRVNWSKRMNARVAVGLLLQGVGHGLSKCANGPAAFEVGWLFYLGWQKRRLLEVLLRPVAAGAQFTGAAGIGILLPEQG